MTAVANLILRFVLEVLPGVARKVPADRRWLVYLATFVVTLVGLVVAVLLRGLSWADLWSVLVLVVSGLAAANTDRPEPDWVSDDDDWDGVTEDPGRVEGDLSDVGELGPDDVVGSGH